MNRFFARTLFRGALALGGFLCLAPPAAADPFSAPVLRDGQNAALAARVEALEARAKLLDEAALPTLAEGDSKVKKSGLSNDPKTKEAPSPEPVAPTPPRDLGVLNGHAIMADQGWVYTTEVKP